MRLASGLAAACTLAVCAAAAGDSGQGPRHDSRACARPSLSPAYVQRVMSTLRATQDVWGNELLSRPSGPTYEGARLHLNPLLLAKGPKGASLTDSGVYYVPFSGQVGIAGSGSMALHVADGSQLLAQRASGRSLTISVGNSGRERYGSCVSRLTTPRLSDGYLPILETRYVDAAGVSYRQESFAARIAHTGSLVSFVQLSADARDVTAGATKVRFTPSESGLAARDSRLGRGDSTHLLFGAGGSFDGSSVTYELPAGDDRAVYVAWLNSPSPTRSLRLDRAAYEAARESVIRHWQRRLAEGMTIEVPERRVLDAQRSLLIQNLGLTWRYSLGNPYQQFSYPEGIDVAQVMGTHGFGDVSRAILLRSLGQQPTRYPNWKIAQKLVGSALHYRLYRDRSYVTQATPVLRGYMAELGRQIAAHPRGMLQRERFSSDIKDSVFGLHSQAVAWQGLLGMARVWRETGYASLASRCETLAARLQSGLRWAVRKSQQRLADGSLFIPARLLDPERPYDSVTETRAGGYWNLVMPYALASGLFAPGSPEANGALRYLLLHGSRLLGLVRAGAYSLYGLNPAYPTSGVNPVYGLNVARFLADNDRPDQLVLSLYGQLAAGMAPGTFVSGEGLSVAPLARGYHRSMYLPPNGASNASFVETLRLMLVHETRDRNGRPRGLELAHATPRAWLRPGGRIVVRRAPTSFGFLAFAIRSTQASVRVLVDVPARAVPRTLSLRLRLPRGSRISAITLGGRRYLRFDVREETIDLSGRSGRLELMVRLEKS
jgi:hypothetical protein